MIIENKLFFVLLFVINFNAYQSDIIEDKIVLSSAGGLASARCYYYEHPEHGYACELSGANIKDENENLNIGGTHRAGKTDDDVLYLNLQKSTFEVLPTNICEKFYRLTSIDMWSVGLKNITEQSFSSCPNLERLGLGLNKLTKLPARAFKDLKFLRIMAIDGNPFEEIEKDAFEGLDNLIILYMSYTKLKKITEHTFAPLIGIEFIQLFHNQIDTIDPKAFTSLTKLWYLNLEKSNLRKIGPDVFKPLISLKQFINTDIFTCIKFLQCCQFVENFQFNIIDLVAFD